MKIFNLLALFHFYIQTRSFVYLSAVPDCLRLRMATAAAYGRHSAAIGCEQSNSRMPSLSSSILTFVAI